MLQFLDLLARLVAGSLEVLRGTSGPGAAFAIAGAVGAIGLASLLVAASVRYVVALAASLVVSDALAHPIEPADRAELIGQSDPDADGHARPRAPALSLSAA
ncbi:DUF6412 domain-containing protein [Diaminobutyricibacter sp. McL0608]|uniref:DUF6412 domain-containing protein n=1 Tax=Leifsonia sp. McL0608 TaxID=3143537 RepID=UPI0031F31BEB